VAFDETVPPVADVPGDGVLPYHTEELALRTFGRSLFAAHCARYSSDFVLMGVTEAVSSLTLSPTCALPWWYAGPLARRCAPG